MSILNKNVQNTGDLGKSCADSEMSYEKPPLTPVDREIKALILNLIEDDAVQNKAVL